MGTNLFYKRGTMTELIIAGESVNINKMDQDAREAWRNFVETEAIYLREKLLLKEITEQHSELSKRLKRQEMIAHEADKNKGYAESRLYRLIVNGDHS